MTHRIYSTPKSNKSHAAYILLFDKLRSLSDGPDWAVELKKWLPFRKEFLQNELKEKGKLICTYCGKNDLIQGYHEFEKKHLNMQFKNLATVDHIHPLSLGGVKYDKDNCCVACEPCNTKKANKII